MKIEASSKKCSLSVSHQGNKSKGKVHSVFTKDKFSRSEESSKNENQNKIIHFRHGIFLKLYTLNRLVIYTFYI